MYQKLYNDSIIAAAFKIICCCQPVIIVGLLGNAACTWLGAGFGIASLVALLVRGVCLWRKRPALIIPWLDRDINDALFPYTMALSALIVMSHGMNVDSVLIYSLLLWLLLIIGNHLPKAKTKKP